MGDFGDLVYIDMFQEIKNSFDFGNSAVHRFLFSCRMQRIFLKRNQYFFVLDSKIRLILHLDIFYFIILQNDVEKVSIDINDFLFGDFCISKAEF